MRTLIPITVPSHAGDALALEMADTVNGNALAAAGRELLLCFVSAVECTVTIPVGMKVDTDLTVAPRVLTLTPNVPFLWLVDTPGIFTQEDGNMYLDFSAACTVAACTS